MAASPESAFRGAIVGASLAGLIASGGAQANEAQKLIEDSASAIRAFAGDTKQWAELQPYFRSARGVIVVPDLMRAGFFFGGSVGQCVMAVRGGPDLEWSPPSFCTLTEASFGLQLGFQKSELLMFVMTDGAVHALLSGTVQVGGDAGLSAGLVGGGVRRATTRYLGLDIYAVSRNQGLFGGLAIDGGWIAPDTEYNHAYYGRAVSARQILLEHDVSTTSTATLQAALQEADQADYANGGGDDRYSAGVEAGGGGDVVGSDLGTPATADPWAHDDATDIALRAEQ